MRFVCPITFAGNFPCLAPGQSTRIRRAAARIALAFLGAIGVMDSFHARAAEARVFTQEIQPLLKEYCFPCHSTAKRKGDLDLEFFSSLDLVKRHPKVWQLIAEQLANNEMPPKEKPQPSPAEKKRLSNWVQGTLDRIAREHAGDPGPVVLRRLSNTEYTYTLRDLTGIDSLQPAREFPVDGAAGEGFMNTGQALVMSPSLLSKYLDAGKEIASHAVFLPDGIRFSTATTRRDWTEEILGRIRAYYRQYTDPSGGNRVNLQGIIFDTNEGGRLPLEKYLAATIDERDALASGKKTVAHVARERGLSARYLTALVTMLSGREQSLLLDSVRARWRAAKPGDASSLAAEIAPWQKSLWKFNSVGHIGKVGGPKAWMEPVNPLISKQEVRLKIPAPSEGQDVTIYLVASDAGDGNENDFVVWERPRLVAPGRPDLLLRDVRAVSRDLPALPGDIAAPRPGPNPALFGRHPHGNAIEESSLCVQAPSVIEIHLPADLAAGCELVTTGTLEKETGREGSVQLQVLATKPERIAGLLPSSVTMTENTGVWTSDNRKISLGSPVVVNEGSAARRRMESAFDDFRRIFPAALCYSKIVPVDEVVTLTLFYREDDQLARLMLDADERATLDRLWDELHFVSHDALTLVDAFAQLLEYATQDADPKVFEPLRGPIRERAAAFAQRLIATEPKHLDGVIEFAARAYRRPLTSAEKDQLRRLYARLRGEELSHDQAIRLALARALVAPAFLYRAENPGLHSAQAPVNDWELASRLSYFLWSSMPDAELREAVVAGKLRNPGVLIAQTRRMLGDARVRRLATEFACQWLHIHDFDALDEKSERHFPTFSGLRGAMYEESIRFFTEFFQHDRPVREIIDADYTFLNGPLAAHYGIPGVAGDDWRRVDGVKQFSRGGILGEAAILSKQSGASRTSPILRGNWVAETLLGDKLPRPPKDVPRLPEDEAAESLTVRQLTEKHSADPRCAACHVRMDAFGFALEGFDSIGRHRQRDLGDHPIDTRARVMDGTEIEGIEGLRHYLLTKKRDAFVRQFCRKLLGYALGRGVQLSDEPLLQEIQAQLRGKNDRVSAAIETIVRSKQFREIRGREMKDED